MTGLGTRRCNVVPYLPVILLERQQQKVQYIALIDYRRVHVTLHAHKIPSKNYFETRRAMSQICFVLNIH